MPHQTINSTIRYDSWSKMGNKSEKEKKDNQIHYMIAQENSRKHVKLSNKKIWIVKKMHTLYAALCGTRARGCGNSLVGLPKIAKVRLFDSVNSQITQQYFFKWKHGWIKDLNYRPWTQGKSLSTKAIMYLQD